MITIYNHTITIEQGITGTSSVNSPALTYIDFMTTKASVYERSRDVRYGDGEELLFTTEFKIRYNDTSKLINNKYRVKYDDKYYKIIEIIETEYKRELNLITEHYYAE